MHTTKHSSGVNYFTYAAETIYQLHHKYNTTQNKSKIILMENRIINNYSKVYTANAGIPSYKH